jgi:hypothetical protein
MNQHSRGLILALIAACSLSCHKQAQIPASHLLANSYQEPSIFINQQALIYDSTALYDSALFVLPPTNRNYHWTISPNPAAAVLGGDYLHGEAQVTFKAAGTYQLSAVIDDSASNTEVARTNTYTIQVQADTLFPTTAISQNEQISISGGGYSTRNGDQDPNDYFLQIAFTTMGTYYANSTIPYTIDSVGGITIHFNDSTSLQGFPFYSGGLQTIFMSVQLPRLAVGNSEPFSVIWLGITYTGTLSRTGSTLLDLTWDNAGPVKVTNGGYLNE